MVSLTVRWTSSRLALVAVLGAINGVITTPLGFAWSVINNTFGILGAAVFQPAQIFLFLAAWLVPIRGAFLLAGTVSGFANFLTGDPTGIVTLYWGVAGGLAGELALLIFRYRADRRNWIVVVAGLLYIPATNIVTFFVFGWQVNTAFWIGIGIALVAITLESSLLAILLGKWILATKLLRSAPVPATPTVPVARLSP